MRCLAIDFGSTTIKGGVLDLDNGTITHLVREPFPEPISNLPTGFHEVSANQIVSISRCVIEQLSSLEPAARHLFAAGQMGGCLLLNDRFQPLTNYLSWRDQRALQPLGGSNYLQQLRTCWTQSQFEQLGSELKAGSATSLLYWLVHNGQLPKSALIVSIGDFVISQLCESVPVWDVTSAIGLVDLTANQWHLPAFETAGLSDCRWPNLVSPGTLVGQMRTQHNTLNCYSVLGDQQAALLGVALQPGELSLNCSTGSQVSEITTTFQPGNYQSRYWLAGQYLNTITHIPAGRSLSVLASLLTELARESGLTIADPWKIISRLTESASSNLQLPNGLTCDLSFFDSPLGGRGNISGITTENLSVGNLFQAAFEYMADAYLECAKRLGEERSWPGLVISGGLVHSFPTLKNKIQSRFQLPIRVTAEQEETLLGLLSLARQSVSAVRP